MRNKCFQMVVAAEVKGFQTSVRLDGIISSWLFAIFETNQMSFLTRDVLPVINWLIVRTPLTLPSTTLEFGSDSIAFRFSYGLQRSNYQMAEIPDLDHHRINYFLASGWSVNHCEIYAVGVRKHNDGHNRGCLEKGKAVITHWNFIFPCFKLLGASVCGFFNYFFLVFSACYHVSVQHVA